MSAAHFETSQQARNDEFCTSRKDIEAELPHYRDAFRGKTVYCNTDNPETSEFWRFFADHMDEWRIRRLTATYYEPGTETLAWHLDAGSTEPASEVLGCNGDFRSPECRRLMAEADVVVTNPPFSLLRPFIAQLMELEKEFLVLAPTTCLDTPEILPWIRDGLLWTGHFHGVMYFQPMDGSTGQRKKMGNICWLTNLHADNDRPRLNLRASYHGRENHYPRYANYAAINIDSVADIPCDYDGIMGVPLTYLLHHCPAQFEILGRMGTDSPYAVQGFSCTLYPPQGKPRIMRNYNTGGYVPMTGLPDAGKPYYTYGGKCYRKTFTRILIRRKDGAA